MPKRIENPSGFAKVSRVARRIALLSCAASAALLLGACLLVPGAEPMSIEGVTRDTLKLDDPPSSEIATWTVGDEEALSLIYVHGTPGSASAFRRYLRDPIPDTRTIAYDRPGFGETEPRDPVVSFEAQARVIEPLLRPSEDGRWPILVGHSLGGPIIARAAADYPDRVGGLVIVAGSS